MKNNPHVPNDFVEVFTHNETYTRQFAIIFKKEGQANFLVPYNADQQDIITPYGLCVVADRLEFAASFEAAQNTALAPQSHFVGLKQAHVTAQPFYNASFPRTRRDRWHDMALPVYAIFASSDATSLKPTNRKRAVDALVFVFNPSLRCSSDPTVPTGSTRCSVPTVGSTCPAG